MKKFFFSLAALASTIAAQAQDLPSNPEPGKCYVRCTTPDVYENQTVQIQITPAYKVLKKFPSTFKTVTEKVLVKEESKKLIVVPATYKTETVNYVKKSGGSTLSIVPASFGSDSETVEIKAAYAEWELGAPAPDCASSNPNDCRYWCYKGYPAEYTTIPTRTLANDASVSRTPLGQKDASYTKRVIATPATVKEQIIPAEYSTITKTVLDKDAYTTEELVPATFKTVSKEVFYCKKLNRYSFNACIN